MCLQPFVFGSSQRYISWTMVELPILITRLDSREDVLAVQTYLVDAEILFLCRKQALQNWNFKIDGKEKILEIQSKIDSAMMKIRMVDTSGGHYGIILKTRARPTLSFRTVESVPEDVPILFLEGEKENLCSL